MTYKKESPATALDKSNKLDILNLEWPSSDRDLHIVTPTLVYLKGHYGYSYKSCNIFKGCYYILKYKPRMLVISNWQGAMVNCRIVKLAHDLNIKVISFISEGNVLAENVDQFLWGSTGIRKLFANKVLLWSERSRRLFIDKYPSLENKLVSVGGTGFDRYKLLKFKTKSEFLKENNLDYDRVIGIAGWGFDHYFNEYYQEREEHYLRTFGKEQIEMYRQDMIKLRNIYQNLIDQNPKVLFILRYHPGVIYPDKTEFYGLEKNKNVFISDKGNTQYQISDLINVSELWMGYETTTALEGWLLNKKTLLINPTKLDFIRDQSIHFGCDKVTSSDEAQAYIDDFYSSDSDRSYNISASSRINKILTNVIGYADGQNYKRASEQIVEVLKAPEKKKAFAPQLYLELLKEFVKFCLFKLSRGKRYSILKYGELDKFQEEYLCAIDV